MKELDTSKTGTISYHEYIASTINLDEYLTPSKLKMIFQTFDKNGDGNISKEELKECFLKNHQEISQDEIDQIFAAHDEDGNN